MYNRQVQQFTAANVSKFSRPPGPVYQIFTAHGAQWSVTNCA